MKWQKTRRSAEEARSSSERIAILAGAALEREDKAAAARAPSPRRRNKFNVGSILNTSDRTQGPWTYRSEFHVEYRLQSKNLYIYSSW